MRKILITGIGGDVACAIIRCLLDSFTDEIIGMDIKPFTPYMNIISEAIVAPRYTDDEYFTFLKNVIIDRGITHFLPTTEQEILISMKQRKIFDDMGVRLIINNDTIISTCTSKLATSLFLKRIGVCSPQTYPAQTFNGELDYPFVLKADTGSGGHELSIIHNYQEWNRAKKENMICQQLVGDYDNEYTVGVFSDGKEVRSIVFKRYLGPGGMSVEVHCIDVPEIQLIASQIAVAMDLKGSINIQIRKQEKQYYVFEINPRLSSTTGFRHKMGFKDATWWIKMLDGEDIPKYRCNSFGDVGVKLMDDIIVKKTVDDGNEE